MAGHFFKFQKGAISLGDDDQLISSFTKRKRIPLFTVTVHGLMACTAVLGISFLLAAYIISNPGNAIARWPE
jgi:hypothetical protein